jgi:hypothetical protein
MSCFLEISIPKFRETIERIQFEIDEWIEFKRVKMESRLYLIVADMRSILVNNNLRHHKSMLIRK